MKSIKCMLVFTILVLFFTFPVISQNSPNMLSARWTGLGGRHVAVADDFYSIFTNPAGFANPKGSLSITQLSMNVAGPVLDIASMVTAGTFSIENIPNLLDERQRLYTRMNFIGPVSIGYTGGGLGLGLVIEEKATLNVTSLSNASFAVDLNALVIGGYAHRFDFDNGHYLDMGFMPKGFIQNNFSENGTLTYIIDNFLDIMTSGEYKVSTGIGVDAGLRWFWENTGLGAGLVIKDLLTPVMTAKYTNYPEFSSNPSGSLIGDVKTKLIPMNLSIGIMYKPVWNFLRMIDTDILFMLDYVDALSSFRVLDRNPILNVGLGAELSLLEILSFRAGIKDALPALGFGVDLTIFSLGVSMYGEELGLEPGTRPVFNMIIALEFVY